MNFLIQALSLLLVSETAAGTLSQFHLSPYDQYDAWYQTQVRTSLSSFHPNLSKGNYKANGPMVSPDLEWNNNGQFLPGRQNFVNELGMFGNFFAPFSAPDKYRIVDGNIGAILFYNIGQQKADFNGIKNEGRHFNVLVGELMQFDANANLNYLITVQEGGLLVEQLTGISKPENVSNIVPETNPQTPPSYRQMLKDNMAALHQNLNAGNNTRNADLVSANVSINADFVRSKGKQSFVDLLAADQKTFPDLIVHDDNILADGHLGAIEFVWQGTQTNDYTAPNGTVIPPKGVSVRVREFLFFEFDSQGLATTVVRVRDDAVIAKQLGSTYVYP